MPKAPLWRRLLRYTAIAVGTGCAIYVAVSLLLPWAVTKILHQQLAARGLADVDFQVRRVSPWGLVLSDIGSGDDGTLRAGAVSVNYSPTSVWRGEIGSIRVSSADVLLSINEGKIDLGTLGAIAKTGGSSSPSDSSGTTTLPARVQIVSSTLKVNWDDTALLLPLDGEMNRRPDGKYDLSAATYVAGSPVKLTGQLESSGAAQLRVDGTLALAAVLAALPGKLRDAAPHCGGAVRVTADYAWTGSTGSGAVAIVSQSGIWAETVAAGELLRVTDAGLQANFSWGTTGTKATARVRDARVALADLKAKLAADVSFTGDEGRVSVSGTGTGFEVRALNATIANAFTRPQVSADINVAGTLPAEVLRSARLNNVVLDRLGPVAVRGTVTASPSTDGVWQARWDGVRLTAGPGDVVLPRRATLAGTQADLVLRGELTGRNLKATLAQGSKISVKEARGALLGPTLAAADLTITDQVTATWDGKTWSASATGARVDVRSEAIDVSGAKLVKPSAALLLSAQATADSAKVRLLEGSALNLDRAAGEGWSTAPVTLAFTPGDVVAWSPKSTTVAAALATAGDVTVTASGASAAVKQLTATAKYDLATGALTGRLTVPDAAVTAPDAGVSVDGLAIDLPVSMKAGKQTTGTITSRRVVIGDKEHAGVAGTIAVDLDARAATAAASWAALSEGAVKADANFSWADPLPRADVRVRVPEFDLTEAHELRKFLDRSSTVEVTGRFAADSQFAYDGDKWTKWGKVRVANAALRNKAWNADLEGIAADVHFTSFAPFETPGGQTASVAKATLGKLNVSDGLVNFRVEPAGTLFVEVARFGWADGTLTARGFRLDPANAAADLVVRADAVAMKDVLSVVSDTPVSGDGKLFGKISVNVRWPAFQFGDGYLYAAPGVGILQLPEAGGEVSDLLESSDPRFKSDPVMSQVKVRVVDAIKDFEYRTFRLELKPGSNGLQTTLNLQGKGRQKSGQELNLNINAEGLDKLLTGYLAVQRRLEAGAK